SRYGLTTCMGASHTPRRPKPPPAACGPDDTPDAHPVSGVLCILIYTIVALFLLPPKHSARIIYMKHGAPRLACFHTHRNRKRYGKQSCHPLLSSTLPSNTAAPRPRSTT